MPKNEIELATLEEVPVREAWKNESSDMTPWLAENLAQLNRALDLNLELHQTEMRVDTFKADIFATDINTGRKVLIENQLETSDHKHLGQILTYLSGLSANVIIWIAPGFREAHLSAVRWLNEHTADPFSFFAVRVRLVRIAQSPLAPIFEVLEQPNQWDREIQEKAKNSEQLSEAGTRRQNFWKTYLERTTDGSEDIISAPATSNRWELMHEFGVVISQYVGKEEVGLFIRSPRGGFRPDVELALEEKSAQLEKVLGVRRGNDRFLFANSKNFDLTTTQGVDAAVDWLADATCKFKRGLEQTLGLNL